MKKNLAILLMLLTIVSSVNTIVFATEYQVKDGDVLWRIARNHNISLEELIKANEIENPDLIYINDVLIIPNNKEDSKMNQSLEKITKADKAVALIESLGTTDTSPVAYINPEKYIQHNLDVADGLAGFGAVVAQLPEGTYATVKRVFTDGDYVILQSEYNFFGPKIGFDIFRFENDLIVEHWDNLTPIAEDVNPSGRSQIDGSTVVKENDQTESNKALIASFVRDVLMGGAPEKITSYINADKYFQHNTAIGDGIPALGNALAALAEAGTPMIYEANHFVLGEGNFVLAVSEGQFLGKQVAFYDLFRIENGLIVEHWDVIQDIPEKSNWMNDNGKF